MQGGSRRTGQWTQRAVVVIATAASVLVLAGCSEGKVRRVVDITVDDQGRARFAPLETTVQKGDRVTLVARNDTDRVHGLTIRGYGVPPMEVGPGAPNDVPFTADRAGTYEIFCQLHPAHRPAVFVVE